MAGSVPDRWPSWLSPVRGNINRMVFTISGFGPQRSPSLFGGSLVAAGLLTTDGMLVGLRRRLVRIGEETWKQGVRFRIAEIPPYYEKSGPSWLGTRRWLVVRRCTLAGNLAKLAHAAVRRRHSRTPVPLALLPRQAPPPRVPESAPSHRLSNVPRRLILGQRFASRDSEHTFQPAGWGEAHSREVSGEAAARSASSRLCLE